MTVLQTLFPELEARSIRRGSIQSLAESGTPENVLLMFSGHKDLPMLYRYLDWGMMRGLMRNLGAEAAVAVWNKNYPDDGLESCEC